MLSGLPCNPPTVALLSTHFFVTPTTTASSGIVIKSLNLSADVSALDGRIAGITSDETPTLKSCRKVLDAIATALKTKWKYERHLGQPQLRSVGATSVAGCCKTSASSKKLLKSLAKYETYIVKMLWSRWAIFEKKIERVRDTEERQKVLRATYSFFQQTLSATTVQSKLSVGGIAGKTAVLLAGKGTKRSGGSAGSATRKFSPLPKISIAAKIQRRDDKIQSAHCPQATCESIGSTQPLDSSGHLLNIFISSTYKIDSIADMLQEEVHLDDVETDDHLAGLEYSLDSTSATPTTNATDDGLLCITVFEPPHPSTSIASAQATTRYFKVVLF